MKLISNIFYTFLRVSRRIKMLLLKPLFKKSGSNLVFDPNGVYSYSTIEIGDDVFIGPGAVFSASNSKIILGSKIMFGPNVTIMGGDHNTSKVGSYMFDVREKLPENDLPVVIMDDVWIGAGATILKGVTIHTGSIIGAGSIVTKDCPPYSIMVGIPAKVVKDRFTKKDLEVHLTQIAKKE